MEIFALQGNLNKIPALTEEIKNSKIDPLRCAGQVILHFGQQGTKSNIFATNIFGISQSCETRAKYIPAFSLKYYNGLKAINYLVTRC